MLNWIKDQTVNAKAAAALPPEKVAGKLLIGELHNAEKPEFSASYMEIVNRVRRTYEEFKGGVRGCASNSD